jgi:hypothetical protein
VDPSRHTHTIQDNVLWVLSAQARACCAVQQVQPGKVLVSFQSMAPFHRMAPLAVEQACCEGISSNLKI